MKTVCWGPRLCSSYRFPGDADAAVLGAALGEPPQCITQVCVLLGAVYGLLDICVL